MYTIQYHAKDLGKPMETKVFEALNAENAWQKIFDIATESMQSLDLFTSLLSHAVEKKWIESNSEMKQWLETQCDVDAENLTDQYIAPHNMIQWWLQNNPDEDAISIIDDKRNVVCIMSIVPESTLATQPNFYGKETVA